MQKNILKILSLSIILLINTLFTQEFYEPHYISDDNQLKTYEGVIIRPDNISTLIGEMPTILYKNIYHFLFKKPAKCIYANKDSLINLNNDLHIRILIHSPELFGYKMINASELLENSEQLPEKLNLASQLQNLIRNQRLALEIMQVTNMATHKYIFHCPTAPEWLIKISSPYSRLVNQCKQIGYNLLTRSLCSDYLKGDPLLKDVPTYQTISVVQNNLILEEIIQKHKMRYISAPKTYIYQLTCNLEDSDLKEINSYPNDSNAIVVQEFIPGLKNIHDNPLLGLDTNLIHHDMIQELKLAIKHIGLWNIKNNLAICMDQNSSHYGKLVIFNTEQHSLTSPDEFTCINLQEWQNLIKIGMSGCCELFAERPDLLGILND